MKKLEAIIQPFKLEDVKAALADIGVAGMTVTDVKGYGQHPVALADRRADEFFADFVPQTKIEIVLSEEKFVAALRAIVTAARTGKFGDGKVFVIPVEEVVRIRTHERTALAT